MFLKVTHKKTFENVLHQIEDAIIQGKLKTGDKLPPERELKQIFNISRGTLREALRVLEQKGLIEIKQGVGGGPVVKAPTTNLATESLALLIRSRRISLEHLCELRAGIEGDIAALAARRAQNEDLVEARRILSQIKENVEGGGGISRFQEFLMLDKRLHLIVAQMTGNPVYMFILRAIHDNIHRFYDEFLPKRNDVLSESYRDHCKILESIEKRNPKDAKEAAKNHVRRNYRFMTKKELL